MTGPWAAGLVVANRYRIDRRIGEGGMATVFLGHDQRHGSSVAVKVLRPELTARMGSERFVREISITAQLQHPNILPLIDSGELEGQPFYVMPFVDGESLSQRLEREGPLPVGEATSIAAEIADALEYAHQRGFVHRDVKPSNIMLAHGHALLVDFGVARAVDIAGAGGDGDRLTETGFAVGTVAYMSPEQATGQGIDPRSDLYALGCVLYEMLAGSPPFTGPPRVVLARHAAHPLPSLKAVRDTIPDAIESVIVRATAKIPADRFSHAQAFRDALRVAATAPDRPARAVRRLRAAAALAAAVALGWAGLALARVTGLTERAPGLDVDRVMVFPLRLSEGFTGPPSAGEDVATLIVSALDGAGALRWIDGLARLDPADRDSYRVPGEDEVRRVARAGRAAHFVTGSVTPAGGGGVSVALALHDTRSGEVIRTVAPEPVPAGDAWRAGLTAASQLLSLLIGGAPDDIGAEWRDRDPRAVASFLRGEAAFRRIRLEEALGNFRDALARDSSFALAALRGAQAAGWDHRTEEAAVLMERASRLTLPARYVDFARGYASYLAGDAEAALAALRRTVADHPDMGEAWLQLGETYTHLLPGAGDPDSLALAALEEATRLDPTATNVLLHLIEIRLRRGEVARAEPLLERFLAAGPDSALATKLELMHRCVRDGPGSLDWQWLAMRRPFELVNASKSLSAGAAHPACAMSGYRALLALDTATAEAAADGRRWASIVALQSLLIAAGRPAEAEATVDSFLARWHYGSTVFLLDAIVSDRLVPRGLAVARESREQFGPYRAWTSEYRLWAVGAVEAIRGDTVEAHSIAGELARRARQSDRPAAGLMERSLQAHLAQRRGDSDEALRALEVLVPAVLPASTLSWDEFAPLGVERLALARLLFDRGDYRRALEVAAVFDSPAPNVYPLFLAESLRLRREAATRLGHGLLVDRFEGRLEALDSRAAGGG